MHHSAVEYTFGKQFPRTNLQKTIRSLVELPMDQQKQQLEDTFLQ